MTTIATLDQIKDVLFAASHRTRNISVKTIVSLTFEEIRKVAMGETPDDQVVSIFDVTAGEIRASAKSFYRSPELVITFTAYIQMIKVRTAVEDRLRVKYPDAVIKWNDVMTVYMIAPMMQQMIVKLNASYEAKALVDMIVKASFAKDDKPPSPSDEEQERLKQLFDKILTKSARCYTELFPLLINNNITVDMLSFDQNAILAAMLMLINGATPEDHSLVSLQAINSGGVTVH